MSKEPFTFPPPPPPPSRKANASHGADENTQHANRGSQRGGRGGRNDRGGRSEFVRRGSRGRGGGYAPSIYGHAQQNPTSFGHADGRTYASQHSDNLGNGSGRANGVSPSRSSFQRNFSSTQAPPDVPENLNPPQKRQHGDAFPTTPARSSRPQAAPAVPSFNADISNLFAQAPAPSVLKLGDSGGKPKKQNQLGLTPSLSDAKSDSEDEDEESKLAQNKATVGHQFEYRGRMSTLKSASDVAAWIAERRKKFPTQAKAELAQKEAEERRLRWESEKKAEREATALREQRRRSEREEKDAKQKLLAALKAETRSTNERSHGSRIADRATKAMLKAEKLQKKALKAQSQLAKAVEKLREMQRQPIERPEDKDGEARKELETIAADNIDSAISSAEAASAVDLVEAEPLLDSAEADPTKDVVPEVSDPSDISSDSDTTSSSGSSGSESEDESDSAPDVVSLKSQDPIRFPPPKRTPGSNIKAPALCKSFLNTGRCKFGDRCRYSHDLPNKQATFQQGSKAVKSREQSRRKSLWQVMVEKEQEEEGEKVLKVIVDLGQRGLLDGDEDRSSKAV